LKFSWIFKRGIYIIQKDGVKVFWKNALSFLSGFFYSRGTYYIYEKDLGKNEIYQFKPKLPNTYVRTISTVGEMESLITKGYDFKKINFQDKLMKGSIAFCAFINKELAHVTWAATDEKSKREIDPLPFKVRFQEQEACSGASFTDIRFRNKGLLSFVYMHIFIYLTNKKITKDKFTINVNNISSQKAHAKFQPVIVGKGKYLKILWWENWKEEPLKELKR